MPWRSLYPPGPRKSGRDVRVLHYLELPSQLDRSGIGTAVAHQRTALAETDVTVRTGLCDALSVRTLHSPLADIDLVHCHLIGPGSFAAARLAKRTDTPLVLHAHVTAEDFAGSFRFSHTLAGSLAEYLRVFYSQATLVLCPSRYTKRALQRYPIEAPIRPITNGVDLDKFETFGRYRTEARAQLDLSGPVVFTVGNVFERKGVETFCRLAVDTDYEFVWFGPYDTGPLASKTVRRWTQTPPANVTFTGWIDDIRTAYAAGDIYLFPTHDENQGIAVLEAMACGKPVVLRRLPVFEEYYTHGEDCLMCETRDEFRAAVDRLADDPGLRQRLGENARETARDHSLEHLGTELTRVYERVRRGRLR